MGTDELRDGRDGGLVHVGPEQLEGGPGEEESPHGGPQLAHRHLKQQARRAGGKGQDHDGGVPDAQSHAEEGHQEELGEEGTEPPGGSQPGEGLGVNLVLPLVEHEHHGTLLSACECHHPNDDKKYVDVPAIIKLILRQKKETCRRFGRFFSRVLKLLSTALNNFWPTTANEI